MTYGEKIKKARARFTLTQTEVGQILGRALVTVGRWETGKAQPTPYEKAVIDRLSELPAKVNLKHLYLTRGPIYCLGKVLGIRLLRHQ